MKIEELVDESIKIARKMIADNEDQEWVPQDAADTAVRNVAPTQILSLAMAAAKVDPEQAEEAVYSDSKPDEVREALMAMLIGVDGDLPYTLDLILTNYLIGKIKEAID